MAGFKEILTHGRNYLIANLATRALAFISIPLYTRLLTPNDYGIVSIYLGVVAILSSVIALSADRSVSRYYFDQKSAEDFKRFVGTSSILATVFFIINSILIIVFAEEFGKLTNLNTNTVYLLIPMSLINVVGLTFEQIYGPLKKSKIIAISSLTRVYIGFAISILLILLFKENKFYGQIIGQIIAGGLMIIYWGVKIRPYFKIAFDKSYLKYIFTYSIPLIPYALSGVIIEQFGKVAIGNSQSISTAGYYSLALTVGSLVSIAISVTHQAWNPYFMQYMNEKNYLQLDKDFIRIFKVTTVVAFSIATFGGEIGLLLAKREFLGSMYLIPVFTIGYVFYQLSYAYLRNFGYSRSTHYMTITVLISGISNVLLNVILIKPLGELGAAISFALSYIIMAILAGLINKYLVKLHSTPIKHMLIPIIISIPFYFSIYTLQYLDYFLISVVIKIILVTLFAGIILWNDRTEIYRYLNQLLKYSS